jgi:hypothetical protein
VGKADVGGDEITLGQVEPVVDLGVLHDKMLQLRAAHGVPQNLADEAIQLLHLLGGGLVVLEELHSGGLGKDAALLLHDLGEELRVRQEEMHRARRDQRGGVDAGENQPADEPHNLLQHGGFGREPLGGLLHHVLQNVHRAHEAIHTVLLARSEVRVPLGNDGPQSAPKDVGVSVDRAVQITDLLHVALHEC